MNPLTRCIVARGCDQTLHLHAHIFRGSLLRGTLCLFVYRYVLLSSKCFERYLDCLIQWMRRFLSHQVYFYLWEARERETGGYFSSAKFYEIKVKASKYLLNEASSKIYTLILLCRK